MTKALHKSVLLATTLVSLGTVVPAMAQTSTAAGAHVRLQLRVNFGA